MRGSATLKQLALDKFGIEFDRLDELDKNNLRIDFTNKAREMERIVDNIIVDGHYSFPSENGDYNVVFTEADRQLYDVFIYMNTNPKKIIENQKNPEPSRLINQYSEKEIDDWQKYEIKCMQSICKSLGIELIVLHDDIDCAISFISELIRTPHRIIPKLIAKQNIKEKQNILEYADTIVLIDCDKTLSINDTTMTFCDYLDFDKKIIRENYRGEYYSTYQFYRANRLYDEIVPDKYYSACDYAADTAYLNEILIADIQSKSNDSITTIAVTAGILDIWERIQVSHSFPNAVIGKGRANSGGYYVSTLVKQAIVEELQALGKKTIAIGDSPVDIGMLEAADYGYLVATQKLNTGVAMYLSETQQTRIKQLKYSPYKYDSIKEVNSIWQL